MTATALLTAYRQGNLSPVDAVETTLQHIDQADGRLHSFLHVDAAGARAAAQEAAQRWARGEDVGPLCGVPVGIKDIIDVAGLPTTCHSRILLDNIALKDAEVVRRLRQAGAIVMGKLATHEFALGGPSFDLPFPPARNPWNYGHNPGGSSSGSAVSVAAGLLPLAVGTDTAGSIRHPAGACGILGLKPGYDAVPRHGVFPLAFSLDHVGPLARSTADLALAFEVMAGRRLTVPLVDGDRPLAGLRIGYVRHFHTHDVPADPEVAAALDATAAAFETLGAVVVEVVLPPLQQFLGINRIIMFSEAWSIHAQWLRERPEDYGQSGRQRLMAGAFLTAEDYLAAQRHRTALSRQVQEVLDGADLLLVANMLDPACRIDDAEALAYTSERQARVAFNVTGHPALSIPTGLSALGMPLSAQLVGPMGTEAVLLRACAALEQIGRGVPRLPDQPVFSVEGAT
ncbi:amidase [Teichococcus wenyumeiae]|nr:amidase [Pseudoroseomonas wenyumeiae]